MYCYARYQLIAILHEFAHFYSELAMEIEDLSSGSDLLLQCPVTQTGAPGRPTIIISQAQIETLVEIGFNYSTIARMFEVSPRTLLRRSECGLPVGHSFTDISETDLDVAVRSISHVGRPLCFLILVQLRCSLTGQTLLPKEG